MFILISVVLYSVLRECIPDTIHYVRNGYTGEVYG